MIRKKGGWDMLIIPAIAEQDETYQIGPREGDVYHRKAGEVLLPDREPREVLEVIKVEIGSMNWAAQYMEDPVPPGGNIIKRKWLRYYDEEDEPEAFEALIASWDLAETINEQSSYSVGTYWGSINRTYYLLDLVRVRMEYPELRQLIIDKTEAWNPNTTLIENTGFGRAVVQDLRRTTPLFPKLSNPEIDKQARLLAQAARFEAGQVLLPSEAEWLEDYEEELLAFPYHRTDDQVDATSQALNYFAGRDAVSRGRRQSITRR